MHVMLMPIQRFFSSFIYALSILCDTGIYAIIGVPQFFFAYFPFISLRMSTAQGWYLQTDGDVGVLGD